MQGGRPRAQLTAKLHELSRQAVQQALAESTSWKTASEKAPKQAATCDPALASATPALLEFGGTRRVLAVLPRDSAASPAASCVLRGDRRSAHHRSAGTDNSLTLCVEADGLSLQHIALGFVERRRDRVEFAQRVHCRTDITWTPLGLDDSDTRRVRLVERRTASNRRPQHAMCKTLVM